MKLDKACAGAHARIRMKQDAGGRTVITDVDAGKALEMLGDDPSFGDDAEGFCILSADGKRRFEAKCFDEADVEALQSKGSVQQARKKRAKRDGK